MLLPHADATANASIDATDDVIDVAAAIVTDAASVIADVTDAGAAANILI